ncbi:FkbM family methyltransferase [Parvularcula sp. LCG005]|uniref:FkbM family methyltransferase n=1 Tax=Parvularcula sp. LCG005 TaxID=3078805 RepID=UPI0029426CE5|nr:FkbM family methyltransferase [Parvularcula sp. LCG005]WOI53732.1 FkbM family methyltransferase [Parvularcula sp. LCG005]
MALRQSDGAQLMMTDKRSDDTVSPYGHYRPAPGQRALLSISRHLPTWEPTYRLALSLQKPLLASMTGPLDVETFGAKIRFHPWQNVCERRALLTPERFDPHERAALRAALPEGGTFVDLGANVGLYTVEMAGLVGPGGRVVSVEPQKRIFNRLAFNCRSNGFDHVRLHNIGVSDEAGELNLYENAENCGEATMAIPDKMAGACSVVPVRPLLDILRDDGVTTVDALKIDIEGHEDRAMAPFMKGAEETLLPKVIVAENSIHHWSIDWLALAADRDYRIVRQDRRNLILQRG